MYKALALLFRPPDGEFRNRFTPQKGSKKNKLEYEVHPFDQTMIHPSMYQTGARYDIRVTMAHCRFASPDKTYWIRLNVGFHIFDSLPARVAAFVSTLLYCSYYGAGNDILEYM